MRAGSRRSGTVPGVPNPSPQRLSKRAGLLAAAFVLAGCAPAPIDASFHGSDVVGGWTRSPGGWGSANLQSPDANRRILGFWAPGGDPAKVLGATAIVSGFLQRHTIPEPTEASLEAAVLDAVFPDLDDALSKGARMLEKEPVTIDGLPGYRLVLDVNTADGVATVVQLSVVNKLEGDIHSIALGCSQSCFSANSETIESVLDAWKVDRS